MNDEPKPEIKEIEITRVIRDKDGNIKFQDTEKAVIHGNNG